MDHELLRAIAVLIENSKRKGKTKKPIIVAQEIMELLERRGYVDSDWWAEE